MITYSKLPVVDPTNRCAICGKRIGEPKAEHRGIRDWYNKHLSVRCATHRGQSLPDITAANMNIRVTQAQDNKHVQKIMSIITGRTSRARAIGVRQRRS